MFKTTPGGLIALPGVVGATHQEDIEETQAGRCEGFYAPMTY